VYFIYKMITLEIIKYASLHKTNTSFPGQFSGTAHVTILLVYPFQIFLRGGKPNYVITFVPSDPRTMMHRLNPDIIFKATYSRSRIDIWWTLILV